VLTDFIEVVDLTPNLNFTIGYGLVLVVLGLVLLLNRRLTGGNIGRRASHQRVDCIVEFYARQRQQEDGLDTLVHEFTLRGGCFFISTDEDAADFSLLPEEGHEIGTTFSPELGREKHEVRIKPPSTITSVTQSLDSMTEVANPVDQDQPLLSAH